MTIVRTNEEVEDQMVLSLRHHVQRTITYQLNAVYPPIEELSPALRAKLAEMDELLELGHGVLIASDAVHCSSAI
jgi:hypothetical protein